MHLLLSVTAMRTHPKPLTHGEERPQTGTRAARAQTVTGSPAGRQGGVGALLRGRALRGRALRGSAADGAHRPVRLQEARIVDPVSGQFAGDGGVHHLSNVV